jgi:hypothetical protein
VCTAEAIWKAEDTRRDPRVALSVTDMADPVKHTGATSAGQRAPRLADPANPAGLR